MLPSAPRTGRFRKSILRALPYKHPEIWCLRSSTKFTSLDTALLHLLTISAIVTAFDYASSYIRDIFCCSEIIHCNKLV